MIRSASALNPKEKERKMINRAAKEVLDAIEVDIINATKNNQAAIDFPIPITYASQEDCNLLIQEKIVDELIAADYTVKIYRDRQTLFNISWDGGITDYEKEKIKKKLEKYTVG